MAGSKLDGTRYSFTNTHTIVSSRTLSRSLAPSCFIPTTSRILLQTVAAADGPWTGRARERQSKKMRRPSRWFSTGTDKRNLLRQMMQRKKKEHLPSKPSMPVRSAKPQFTAVQDAPAHVRHRILPEPDAPDDATALDVAVVGRPNAGKSSLLNRLLDFKVGNQYTLLVLSLITHDKF